MQIKLCGIRNVKHLQYAENAGATFVGLNFVHSSKRFISVETGKTISSAAKSTTPVGVFMNQDEATILKISKEAQLNWIQLHGDEPPAFCEALAKRFKVIKALRYDDATHPDRVNAYRECVSLFLIDGKRPGSGESWDWAQFSQDISLYRPFFLAGGLKPENVEAAIRSVLPDGVDTASGIEDEGQISERKIRHFCDAANGARTTPELNEAKAI
jgi:phosphoribosylanthranilate isomerase